MSATISESLEAAINHLEKITASSRRLASTLRAAPGMIVLHHVLVRYLHWATESAEMILLATRAGKLFGTQPHLRHLMETLHEVTLLLTRSDRKEAAVRVYLWDSLFGWEDEWSELKRAAGRAPSSILAGRRKTQTIEEAYAQERRKLEGWGADVDLLDKVWRQMRDQRRERRILHWTGLQSYEKRNELILEKVPEGFSDKYEDLIGSVFFWGRGSYSVHASPRFRLLPFRHHPDGRYEPTEVPNLENRLRATADGAADQLASIRNLVAQNYLTVQAGTDASSD